MGVPMPNDEDNAADIDLQEREYSGRKVKRLWLVVLDLLVTRGYRRPHVWLFWPTQGIPMFIDC